FFIGAFVFLLLPNASKAAITAEILTINDEADLLSLGLTDVSDLAQDPEHSSDGIVAIQYPDSVEFGTEYTAEVQLSEDSVYMDTAPMLMIAGGKVVSSSFDESNAVYTITFTVWGFQPPGSQSATNEFVLVFSPLADEGQEPGDFQGAPAAMAGGYINMNVNNFSIIPPSEGEAAFGVNMTGYAGSDGYFQMYLPEAMLSFMSQMSGQTITYSDLGVYVDNQMASISVTEKNEGAFIDINVTFTSGITKTTAFSSTEVTKQVEAKTKPAVSLASKKARVKKGKKVRLFGWTKQGTKGKTVTIKRSLKKKSSGFKKYKVFKKLTTKKSGYYSVKISPKKTAKYKAFFKKNKNATKKKSTAVKVKVSS
ncbi:MAG: hypothetical protein ABID45_03335, partial [Patescibacteria group bacterium]